MNDLDLRTPDWHENPDPSVRFDVEAKAVRLGMPNWAGSDEQFSIYRERVELAFARYTSDRIKFNEHP